MTTSAIGLGDVNARFKVYIANRPPLVEYQNLVTLRPLQRGEIARIAAETGNHWRKIFNVYAKLVFAENPRGYDRWQNLRDDCLLQAGSDTALVFSPPPLQAQEGTVCLLLGKGYATECGLNDTLHWLDERFARHSSGLLVCPYFDYRQLSDARIQQLIGLLP